VPFQECSILIKIGFKAYLDKKGINAYILTIALCHGEYEV